MDMIRWVKLRMLHESWELRAQQHYAETIITDWTKGRESHKTPRAWWTAQLLFSIPCTSVNFLRENMCFSPKCLSKCHLTPKCLPLTPSHRAHCLPPAVTQTCWRLTSSIIRSLCFWSISIPVPVEQKYPSTLMLNKFFVICMSVNSSLRDTSN